MADKGVMVLRGSGRIRTAGFLLAAGTALWNQVTAGQASTSERAGYRLHRVSIIGDDERRAPGDGDRDLLRAVGVVVCSAEAQTGRASSRATGTLVGSRQTILTAAHVFSAAARRSRPAVEFDPVRDCVFQQYDSDGGVILEARFENVAFGAFRRNPGLPHQDWAVLRTTEPLPGPAMPLAYAGLATEDLERARRFPIAVLAFHADLRNRRRAPSLSVGELFAVDYAGFRRLAHTADMGRMSSGAALVHTTADGTKIVVGVHRSAANFGEYNLAVPIAGALEAALDSLAHGRSIDSRQRIAFEPTQRSRILAARKWTRDL